MLRVPQLKQDLAEIGGSGYEKSRISEITSDWVNGKGLEAIAQEYFSRENDDDAGTAALTDACRAIYRTIVNSGTWGVSALSRVSGIDFEKLSEADRRRINALPAMIYHGVSSEDAVLMRMNAAPRSAAEALGSLYREVSGGDAGRYSVGEARRFLQGLGADEWDGVRPEGAALSGTGYKRVWEVLSRGGGLKADAARSRHRGVPSATRSLMARPHLRAVWVGVSDVSRFRGAVLFRLKSLTRTRNASLTSCVDVVPNRPRHLQGYGDREPDVVVRAQATAQRVAALDANRHGRAVLEIGPRSPPKACVLPLRDHLRQHELEPVQRRQPFHSLRVRDQLPRGIRTRRHRQRVVNEALFLNQASARHPPTECRHPPFRLPSPSRHIVGRRSPAATFSSSARCWA